MSATLMRLVRRWAGGLLPGAAARRLQVVEFAAAWRESNEAALSTVGPLWVALGDSTGQGIGASAWDAATSAGSWRDCAGNATRHGQW